MGPCTKKLVLVYFVKRREHRYQTVIDLGIGITKQEYIKDSGNHNRLLSF